MTDFLESKLAALTDRIERLETELERKDERIVALEDRLEDHDERLDDCPTSPSRATEAILKKANANKTRLRELQSRELEKGAHLGTATVDPAEVSVPNGRLEKLSKDDGNSYYRCPETDDPLDHTVTASLARADLLPIQQLARMDEDLRRSTTDALPTRLAAKLWRAGTDPTAGDDPWSDGCKSIRKYVSASDVKHWIRRRESGISETYAKKLVSRTIDAILDLSKNRLAVRKRTQRKNGLEYTERRLILPRDAEIPGETTTSSESTSTTERRSPETTDVLG